MKSKFERMWEESKVQYQKDVAENHNKFRRTEFRKWEKLMSIIGIFLPFVYTWFANHRRPVKQNVSKIIQGHAPELQQALSDRAYWFHKWEQENSDPKRLSASEDTILNDSKSVTQLTKLCDEFIQEIKAVEGYEKWFHTIENPSNFIENPYPGFLCTTRAQNYVKMLAQKF